MAPVTRVRLEPLIPAWDRKEARRRGEKGMNKTVLLIDGVGLGAGLIYMLDPERGEQCRAVART
jgi:hypothetical protein